MRCGHLGGRWRSRPRRRDAAPSVRGGADGWRRCATPKERRSGRIRTCDRLLMGELLYRAELRSGTPGGGCSWRRALILKVRARCCRASRHEPTPADSGRRQGSSREIRRDDLSSPQGRFPQCAGERLENVSRSGSCASFLPSGGLSTMGGSRWSTGGIPVSGAAVGCSVLRADDLDVLLSSNVQAARFAGRVHCVIQVGPRGVSRRYQSSGPRRRRSRRGLSTFLDPSFLLSVPDGTIEA